MFYALILSVENAAREKRRDSKRKRKREATKEKRRESEREKKRGNEREKEKQRVGKREAARKREKKECGEFPISDWENGSSIWVGGQWESARSKIGMVIKDME